MASFLRDKDVCAFDIIAVQEPWPNNYNSEPTTNYPNSDSHHLFYPSPSEYGGAIPRVYFYIFRRIHTEAVSFRAWSRDLLTAEIALDSPDEKLNCLRIHNIYNEPEILPAALGDLERALYDEGRFINPTADDWIEDIVIGDLNVHHPQWGGTHVKADRRSDALFDIID